jgi:triphosphatase
MRNANSLAAQLPEIAEAAHPVEVEVKFRATPAVLADVFRSALFGALPEGPRELRSTYFETAEFDLHKAGIVLRVRSDGHKQPLMCVKFDVAQGSMLFHRHEVEAAVEGMDADVARFGKKIARKLTRLTGGRPLERKFDTLVTRQLRPAARGGSLIEAAFDEGLIQLPDGRQLPLCELELELKSGTPADLFALARQLAEQHKLRLDVTSKSEKGFALLRETAPSPVKAERLKLSRSSAGEAILPEILSNTIGHFTANWRALKESDDPESVHQLRVSLRRMRSAFKVFGRISKNGEMAELKDEAGRIASQFGRVRDLSVFRAALADGPLRAAGAESGVTVAGFEAVEEESLRQHAEALAAARDLLDSHALTDFVLRVEGFALGRGPLPMPPRKAAAAMLQWLHARALKRGKGLAVQSAADRHRLRIALKDLRYGIAFLSGLFGRDPRAAQMEGAVAKLQGMLGARNDAAVAAVLAIGLGRMPGADGAAASGFIAGWMAHAATQDDAKLAATWKALRKQRVFWLA